MPPGILEPVRRWFSGAQSAWPVFLIGLLAAFFLGHHLTPQTLQPLTPPFAFTNGTNTIEASGAWQKADTSAPNATKIFCWLPANSCQVSVAQLVPDGSRSRFQLSDQSFDIRQLSDATLTATASSTNPCQVQTLRIDRKRQSATLSVGPTKTTKCTATPTQTATLGG
jgi:hypothetical protein